MDNRFIHTGYTKAVLRRAMQGILPESIRLRTDKMGFVTSERVWLSGALKPWIKDVVNSPTFRQLPYFDVNQIITALAEHDTHRRDLTFLAWRWINLELWLRQFDVVPGAP